MKKYLFSIILLLAFLSPNILSAKDAKGLNVVLTAKNEQTQMMAMVLAMKTLEASKEVRMTLCASAGHLALKSFNSTKMKPMNKSAKMLLQAIIKKGAIISICPLFLPNVNKNKFDLLEGIKEAKPALIAKQLLDLEYTTLSY